MKSEFLKVKSNDASSQFKKHAESYYSKGRVSSEVLSDEVSSQKQISIAAQKKYTDTMKNTNTEPSLVIPNPKV